MAKIPDELTKHRLVPVIALDSADDALPLADALIAGGLPVAEVTFRTGAAAKAIEQMRTRSGLLVGAGTVLSLETAQRAIDAGSQFIVMPGFSSKIVQFCQSKNIPVIPGGVTPTDIQTAIEHGLDTVKFFPAEQFGGVKTIKAISPVFGGIKFMPTGGVTLDNLRTYLDLPNVAACGGSWMVAKDLLAKKDFKQVETLVRQSVQIAAQGK